MIKLAEMFQNISWRQRGFFGLEFQINLSCIKIILYVSSNFGQSIQKWLFTTKSYVLKFVAVYKIWVFLLWSCDVWKNVTFFFKFHESQQNWEKFTHVKKKIVQLKNVLYVSCQNSFKPMKVRSRWMLFQKRILTHGGGVSEESDGPQWPISHHFARLFGPYTYYLNRPRLGLRSSTVLWNDVVVTIMSSKSRCPPVASSVFSF